MSIGHIKQFPIPITVADSAVIDAFSRLRVSVPATLFSSTLQYQAGPLLWETGNTSDGQVLSYSANTRMVTLAVNTGSTGGTSWLQSRDYFPYSPGKSQKISMTGVMGAGVAGAVKRVGYGDDNNGIFLEQNGTNGLQVNRRTSTSGSVANNTVAQASWNIDKFDGTGPSGVNLDVTKGFILTIDFQFLGMGRIRIGFDIGGVLFYAHQFLVANVLSVPSMQQATLPLLFEVTAVAGLGSNATLLIKCAEVSTEGNGIGEDSTLLLPYTTEGTVTAGSGTRTHILSIRPALTFTTNNIINRSVIYLQELELLNLDTANPVKWELGVGATFSGAPTFASVQSNSSTEAGTGGTVSTLPFIIDSGYISASGVKTTTGITKELNFKAIAIVLNRAGAQTALGTLSLCVTGIGGTAACRAIMDWLEIR